ncbi:MAG: hypothetical protein IH987_19695 [Planctomycetes bacterium]|nr:hypothetical protein [Planctomycetota bacterium]
MRRIGTSICAVGLLVGAGCAALPFLLFSDTVRVTLINETGSSVDVELFLSDEQNIPRLLLLEVDKDFVDRLGERVDMLILPGGRLSFFRSCDDLQAIVVGDADLNVLGGLGPDASSDVIRDGSDFGCGDEIQFIFHDGGNLLDFDVDVVVLEPTFAIG